MKFSDQKIIVTGCASGIGAKTCELLKKEGATVIGVDRNPTTQFVDEFHHADLSDPVSIDALIEALPSGANGLLNIAGVPPTAGATLVLQVNLLALKRLTLGCVDKLADNAAIVNVASLAGVGWPEAIPSIKAASSLVDFDQVGAFCEEHNIDDARSYAFSKEALITWTMQNRWTWRDRGIRMNCVSPGPVETPILKDFIATLGKRVEEDMKVMDRPGTPDDIAPAIVFLASADSVWIRGTNLACDGGMFNHIQCAMNDLL
ncbi:coniferyl-alcohol dehydrogenase [Marinomonas pollencensis]|uniref:NAD(P)-dependent dehydrogenase (Short-subunit alcohol dehydrogenase family) n=1 Tax=Marinomonas pollencensis TaxID=491954 RepID=A0A3E0DKC5_9GAMM|nr:coniferyl-alcohol dehydrogenase [Marinomonas pollencensis]REG81930.1 NAD(P)-dependent dehydrogenase (short-subunit alcohol dehydrogenase family) [Marinomonas pollencensis]